MLNVLLINDALLRDTLKRTSSLKNKYHPNRTSIYRLTEKSIANSNTFNLLKCARPLFSSSSSQPSTKAFTFHSPLSHLFMAFHAQVEAEAEALIEKARILKEESSVLSGTTVEKVEPNAVEVKSIATAPPST